MCGITTMLAALVPADCVLILAITLIIDIGSQKGIKFGVACCDAMFMIHGLWGIGVRVIHHIIMFLVLLDLLMENMIKKKITYN